MKLGRMMLTVAGATAAICSAFAFKAQNMFNGRTQLFTKGTSPCHQVDVWTVTTGGTPAPANKYFPTNQCQTAYSGNVVLID